MKQTNKNIKAKYIIIKDNILNNNVNNEIV